VISDPKGEIVLYGELVRGKTFSIMLDPKKPVPTKAPNDFSLVGRPIQRVDIPDKMTGRYTFMHDFLVPGMLHGRVVRPPTLGAELQSVDETSVKDVPGIVKIVRQGNFLGIVATTEWAAISGAQALKASWSKWGGLPDQAGIDSSGEVAAWMGEFFMPEQRPASQLIVPLLTASLAGLPADNDVGTGGIRRDLELNRSTCLLLDEGCSAPNISSRANFVYSQFD
jgi:hypothetical protein